MRTLTISVPSLPVLSPNRRGARMSSKVTTERDFARQVIDLAHLYQWRVHRNWTELHSPKGWPDLVLCRPPRLLFVELKSEKGRTTPEQESWLADLQACGQYTCVWRPSDWDEIVKVLGW